MADEKAQGAQALISLLNDSKLEAVVPNGPPLDRTTLDQGRRKSPRSSLFLDENVTVHVILHSPYADEATFRALLANVEINLETFAVGNPRQPPQPQQQQHQQPDESAPQQIKDLLDSRTFAGDADPTISVTSPEDDGGSDGKACVVVCWHATVHISRPRIRSKSPSIYFAATLTLHCDEADKAATSTVEYMQSGVPGTINILEPFKLDPIFRKRPPVLSADRLAKVLPTGSVSKANTTVLRNSSRPLHRLLPVINTKIRFARTGASSSHAKVLASLDVDVTPTTKGTLSIQNIELSLSEGRAENIDTETFFPISCKARDGFSFVYNLIPNYFKSSRAAQSSAHNLFLTLLATCNPDGAHGYPIKVHWRTPVDLTALHQRPAVFDLPSDPRQSMTAPRSSIASSGPSARSSTSSLGNYLLTLTVSGPPTVPVHSTLRWSLLITNRSLTRSLHLAIIPITSSSALPAETTNRAQMQAAKVADAASITSSQGRMVRHKHRPTLSTTLFSRQASQPDSVPTGQFPDDPVALPVSKPAILAGHEDAGLVPLTADIRIGPLAPGACATAEMRFLVLRTGLLPVEALRLVDLEGELQRRDEQDGQGDTAWEQGGEVEGQGRRRRPRAWVDIGPGMLPDVIAVDE